MTKFERECWVSNWCINETIRLRLIECEEDENYREVVLECGDECIDIVYNRMGSRAKHDLQHIKEDIVTYGYEQAKELAEYYKNRNVQLNY